MTATLLFWAIAAAMALGCLALVFAPMLRGRGAALPRARYDAKVFRDQLREIEADKARGLMTEAEARATEIEVSRRLLATAEADAAAGAPGPRRVSRLAGAALIAALLAGGAALYLRLGAPGLEDQPLLARLERAQRERAERPGQAEIEAAIAARRAGEPAAAPGAGTPPGPRIGAVPGISPEDLALIDQLREVLRSRPDDERGHRLLVRTLSGVGDWAGARAAQGEVLRILGDRAGAADYAEWAEYMILATDGYVSPEAEAALGEALTRDPSNPLARYYSGLTLAQGGRPDLAYRMWSGLLAEGPEEAPWIPTIRAQIGEVARLAGLPPPPEATPPAAPGPTAGDVEAAGEMSPEARQSMVEGMVDQLATRLDAEGGGAEDWARLIRAQGVLGRIAAAQASWDKAKAAHAADPAALATLAAAAREAGLTAR
ncbi:MAG: c-type cytochrome biogenesis protein CcmI [Rhodovulum sulfidophilum]|uniref:C-type cytochrome biogenesis protein CcmI n=1 Tax=Rhodovulum sulfidophilum TaxID=35806 RepID=A0A2W5N9W6_RHOSU|nr:MAG: c-type cytochrome biogenesis protein CcmI [Rhodovulum sulfidophilum]